MSILLVAQQHPVSEAIFNFAGSFSFLMLPLFIYDTKGKRKIGMWTAILVSSPFENEYRMTLAAHTLRVDICAIWQPYQSLIDWKCFDLKWIADDGPEAV